MSNTGAELATVSAIKIAVLAVAGVAVHSTWASGRGSTIAAVGSYHSGCDAAVMHLRPGFINQDGTRDLRGVSAAQPRDVLSVGAPLFLRATPSHPGIAPVSYPPMVFGSQNAGAAFYEASASVSRAIVWYRRAFQACGFRQVGPTLWQQNPRFALAVFASPLTHALTVTVRLERLTVQRTGIVYLASALSTPVRPHLSYVPWSAKSVTINEVIREDARGKTLGYKITVHRAASVRLLIGLLNEAHNTAGSASCPGGSRPPLVPQWMSIRSHGRLWRVRVIPNACGGVFVKWGRTGFTALGCNTGACGHSALLTSDAIDTVVKFFCATHECRLTELQPPVLPG